MSDQEIKKNYKKYLSFLSLGLIPLIAFFNRQRGKDTDKRFLGLPKLAIYVIISFCTIPFIVLFSDLPLNNLYTYGVSLVGIWLGLIIQLGPSWGECFPGWHNNTSQEDFAWGVKPLATKWAGFAYVPKTPIEDGVKWRTYAMSVRWGLYSIPLGVILSVLFWSFIPLGLIYPVVMLLAGPVYAFYHVRQKDDITYDAVADAEPIMGGLMGVSLATIIIGYGFLILA